MNEHDLTRLLQSKAAEIPAKTRFCPDEDLLVRYFEGQLAEEQQGGLERHVADCRYCQGQLGNLARGNEPEPVVSGHALAEAKQLTDAEQGRGPRHTHYWAAAAVLVLALFVTFGNRQPTPLGPELAPVDAVSPPRDRQLRSVSPRLELRVLNPTPGADIATGSTLRWAKVPGTIHYDILVLSSTGDVLLTERLTESEWQLGAHPGLATGDRYYLRVIAYLADGRTVNSRHVEFTLEQAE